MPSEPLDIALRLSAVIALVLANGFFVAAEFALVTVRKTRVDQLIAEGNRRARSVRQAIAQPDNYIAATQLGITMASLGLGWIGEPAIARLIEPALQGVPASWARAGSHSAAVALAFAFITALHIVFGELAPKTVALQNPEGTSLLVATPTRLFMRLFWPFITLLNGMGRRAVALAGLRAPSGHALVHSEEELKMLVTASQEAGVIEEEEEQMLHRVFGFGDLTAGHVMVPRTEISGVPADSTLDALIDRVAIQPQPWLVVFGSGPDDILGFLHVEDLLAALRNPGAFDPRRCVREAFAVPETMKADEVLEEMKGRGTHHVVVIDEYGGTAGLITFLGLMERIVGEVPSGHRASLPKFTPLADGSVLVDGLALVADANERFGLHVDESVYNTFGGFVLGELGRRARVGDHLELEGRTLRVEALDGLRVSRIHVSPQK
jgi:CBS domain containing-hemolysin-like protein